MKLKFSWLGFLVVWPLAVAAGYFKYVPETGKGSLFQKIYRSGGVIYLRPSAWRPFGELYIGQAMSPVDVWFGDTSMIAHLVERRQLGRRAAAKLAGPKVGPEVMSAALMVTPVSHMVGIRKMFLSRLGEEEATFDESGQGVTRVQRINFLRVQAYGKDPADAQRKAEAWVKVLQETLGELATEDLQNKTTQLKQMLTTTEKKMSQARLAWREVNSDRSLLDESKLLQLQRDRADLTGRISLLELQANNLQNTLSQGGVLFLRQAGLLAASDAQVQEAQHLLRSARAIYQPDSERVQVAQERLAAFTRLRQMAAALDSSSQIEFNTRQLRSLRKILADNDRQQAILMARRLSPGARMTRAQRSAQIDTWDRQISDWQLQLFRMRLLVRLGKADGSSEVIQWPRPGEPVSRFGGNWRQRYKGFMAWIPLATFLAFVAALLGAIYDRSREAAWRVEKYLDGKVLEVFPVLSRNDVQAWESAKHVGRA